jgi:PAS domain-containing protein
MDTPNTKIDHKDENFTGAFAVLETATDGFVTCDYELRITYLNSAAEQLYGRSKPEILAQLSQLGAFSGGIRCWNRDNS